MVISMRLWKKVDRRRIGRAIWVKSLIEKTTPIDSKKEKLKKKLVPLVNELYETVMIEPPKAIKKEEGCEEFCPSVDSKKNKTYHTCVRCLELHIDSKIKVIEDMFAQILISDNNYAVDDLVSDVFAEKYLLYAFLVRCQMATTINLLDKTFSKIAKVLHS